MHSLTQSIILAEGEDFLRSSSPFADAITLSNTWLGRFSLEPRIYHSTMSRQASLERVPRAGSSASSLVQLALIRLKIACSFRASLSLAPSKLDSEDLD
jgi:hypothetical protein